MKFQGLYKWLAPAVLALGVAFASPAAQAQDCPAPSGDPIGIGFNVALSGATAGWGLPGKTGLQMWVDDRNAGCGLLGRPVELHLYDNEYIASKALQGARKLVFENDVKFITGIGGTTGDSQIPFLTEAGVFYAPLSTVDLNPQRPYTIAGTDVFPRGEMMRPLYIKSVYPDLKTMAIVSQEDPVAEVGQSYEVGASQAAGWEVVYDAHFAADTADFAPVVTAILATNPDYVSMNVTWPDYIPLIMEQLYLQGYEGPISANYIEWSTVLPKVPAEWAAKVKGFESYPRFDDPWFGVPSMQANFASDWIARYGPGGPDDVGTPMTGIDWLYVPPLQIWADGVEKAGTLEPDAVIEAIRSNPWVMTLEGPATITGEEMWGIRNMMSQPVPTTEFSTECNCKRIVDMQRFEPWFEAHKAAIIGTVESRGHMWYQRQ